ncbi:thiol reductant ABC exporter subunit CydD [Varibaculum vaginae]|uniref:thiol reductant ABC exporter subunit CydD n=1 Tax=Varibaculum vaginae TaxID=2364797 RepID=UPI00190F875E|nr:thiol reductant ABC exporter subunit CydD [Varibaculum vaginae]
MKPLDPRLLKYARSARLAIAITAITGIMQAGLVVAQCFLISALISPVISLRQPWDQVAHFAFWLAAISLARVALTYFRSNHQHKAAKKAIRELRGQVLAHCLKLGPRWLARKGTDTVTLATRGLEKLGPYFVDYIPQLILAVTVTPLVLLVMAIMDFWSALVAIITIPLIPIFMVIIGLMTQSASDRRLATMQHLGRQLLDLVAGLATLKSLGRHRGPEKQISSIGKTYTQTTMATLRIAFLSGAVLEFISILSVAIVAVTVGLRMVAGGLDLYTGLIAIMLAPEVYAPVRQVGKFFHASADGLSASQSAFEILETAPATSGDKPAPNLKETTITITDLGMRARGAWAPNAVKMEIKPATITALIGKSGEGKTTTVMTLLKQLSSDRGSITLTDASGKTRNLDEVSPDSWWEQTSWLPQMPLLLPGTLAQNIAESPSHLNELFPQGNVGEKVRKAARLAGFEEVVAKLPDGWNTFLRAGGEGISGGQRQRLALVRALLSTKQLIVLDEPSAHLDAHLVAQVAQVVQQLKETGKTVVLIAHRQELAQLADQVIPISSLPFTAEEAEKYKDSQPQAARASEAKIPEFLGSTRGLA